MYWRREVLLLLAFYATCADAVGRVAIGEGRALNAAGADAFGGAAEVEVDADTEGEVAGMKDTDILYSLITRLQRENVELRKEAAQRPQSNSTRVVTGGRPRRLRKPPTEAPEPSVKAKKDAEWLPDVDDEDLRDGVAPGIDPEEVAAAEAAERAAAVAEGTPPVLERPHPKIFKPKRLLAARTPPAATPESGGRAQWLDDDNTFDGVTARIEADKITAAEAEENWRKHHSQPPNWVHVVAEPDRLERFTELAFAVFPGEPHTKLVLLFFTFIFGVACCSSNDDDMPSTRKF